MLIFTCRYWTDNGACYYYTTGNFSNYEDVIVAVKKEADEDGTPFRYVQVTFNTILTYNTYHITQIIILMDLHTFKNFPSSSIANTGGLRCHPSIYFLHQISITKAIRHKLFCVI